MKSNVENIKVYVRARWKCEAGSVEKVKVEQSGKGCAKD